jgi:hypothetical protein
MQTICKEDPEYWDAIIRRDRSVRRICKQCNRGYYEIANKGAWKCTITLHDNITVDADHNAMDFSDDPTRANNGVGPYDIEMPSFAKKHYQDIVPESVIYETSNSSDSAVIKTYTVIGIRRYNSRQKTAKTRAVPAHQYRFKTEFMNGLTYE